jgi:hypothetical protein
MIDEDPVVVAPTVAEYCIIQLCTFGKALKRLCWSVNDVGEPLS